jgi:hypothetical protein
MNEVTALRRRQGMLVVWINDWFMIHGQCPEHFLLACYHLAAVAFQPDPTHQPNNTLALSDKQRPS